MPICSSSVVRVQSWRGEDVMIHYQDRWAVVTGASSGLGRGLAARLADLQNPHCDQHDGTTAAVGAPSSKIAVIFCDHGFDFSFELGQR